MPFSVRESLANPKSRIFACPRSNEDVGGLDVAMDDPLGVGCIERVGNLGAQIEQHFNLECFALDRLPERLPFEHLHDDEGVSIGLVNLVNGADVGMVQRRRGLGFTPKTGQRLGITGDLVGQEL